MNPADIPPIEAPGPDTPARAVQFIGPAPAIRRRGFLRIVGTAATTLGLTVLGWIPLVRPAKAAQGSEHPDCGRYNDGAGGIICYGAPYSPSYCGRDKWFKDGCFGDWDGGLTCYQPRTICRAGDEARDAWLWKADDVTYRCADGDVHYDGAPNLEQVICNAVLTQQPTKPSRSSRLP